MGRRKVLLFTFLATLMLLTSGGALAATYFSCSQQGTTCTGTDGDDDIWGSEEAQTISAKGGNDYVDGFFGDDTIYGGDSGDNRTSFDSTPVSGGSAGGGSDDKVYSDNRNSFGSAVGGRGLLGAEGSDRVYGGGGPDNINAAAYDTEGSIDYSYGGRGNDTIYAVDGNRDVVNCGRGTRDRVYYDRGIDTVKNCEKKHPS